MADPAPKRPYWIDCIEADTGAGTLEITIKMLNYRLFARLTEESFFNSPQALASYRVMLQNVTDPDITLYNADQCVQPFAKRFVADFELAAPSLPDTSRSGRETLACLQCYGLFECYCRIVDERVVTGGFDMIPDTVDFLELPERWKNGPVPIYTLDQVEVPEEDTEKRGEFFIPDEGTPRKVLVNEESFQYTSIRDIGPMEDEISQHFKIMDAELSYPDLRLMPLSGIVINDKDHVKGIMRPDLLICPDEHSLINYALAPPPGYIEDWKQQLYSAVKLLYGSGLGLGPVDIRRVAIDWYYGDVLIMALREGPTSQVSTDDESLVPFLRILADAELRASAENEGGHVMDID